MLKKKFRLSTSEFKEVFDFGKTLRNPHFVIKHKPSTLSYSRFSVVVSKKIAKKAVERNYLRRRTYHALQDADFKLPVGDYVFILNSSAKDIQYKDLLNNFNTLTS